jgi:hypothetical protein
MLQYCEYDVVVDAILYSKITAIYPKEFYLTELSYLI